MSDEERLDEEAGGKGNESEPLPPDLVRGAPPMRGLDPGEIPVQAQGRALIIHDRGPSPARTPGRQGVRVDRIVWHHIGAIGTVAGALSWVIRPGSQESYHYLIDEGGTIFRVVNEGDTSWHAGNWSMNLRSIGISHPPNGGGEATRRSSVALAQDICRRYGLAANGTTIIPHRAVVPTACPGSLPMAEWIAQVAGQAPQPEPEPSREVESTMKQRIVATEQQQHFVYLVPVGNGAARLFHRCWDHPSGTWSAPHQVSDLALSDDAGVDAVFSPGLGGELHVFCRHHDTSRGTGARFWVGLPWRPGANWGYEPV